VGFTEVMDDAQHFDLNPVLTASATAAISSSSPAYGYTVMFLFTLVSDNEVSSILMRSTTNIFVLLHLALVL